MRDGVHPLVEQLVALCVAKGVHDFIIAPGSRSAPLTIALGAQADITCRVVYDERSAGYVALGLAQQRNPKRNRRYHAERKSSLARRKLDAK